MLIHNTLLLEQCGDDKEYIGVDYKLVDGTVVLRSQIGLDFINIIRELVRFVFIKELLR
jgi:hypothetical protein